MHSPSVTTSVPASSSSEGIAGTFDATLVDLIRRPQIGSVSFSIANTLLLLTKSRCDLTIVKEFRPADLPKPHQHLGNLLDGEVEGDMKFKVTGGETFTAHKYILAARSPVFMAEFFGPKNKETTTTTTMAPVKVINMDPRVFKALLHFIYTDELPEIDDDDSDRYEMERLKLLCDDVLWYHIDESTVVTWLQLADKHGCPRLKQPAPSSSVTSSKELLSDALNLLQRFKREPCLFFLLKIVN
ncbi:hypothetical protein PR202_gb13426 [Eleusine coracana subsp. coracana]|uniref:BTB domain-containing protein n=1 Tax=Eleusine coracana subsp. coracana TaxID=191504 RepID=A0AAV5ESL5_ELECO|nr:hypothetical protein PR202_gb13426 [Eleusine coracana subsp. coracana]